MYYNTIVHRFVGRLNHLNHYLLFFPEETPKKLDQNEKFKILDQTKAMDHERNEVIFNANIDIFEMSSEESVSYFNRLENLEKIKCFKGPSQVTLPVV
jgi:hypothetical protein